MYLDGDSKVIPVFYFWDEVLNPAGDLQQHSRSDQKKTQKNVTLFNYFSVLREETTSVFIFTVRAIHLRQ